MKENTKIHKEKKPHWHDANANEEHRKSPTLQRATFLGSAIVRSTPQIKDKKHTVLLHASGAVPINPKTQTNIPDYGCLLD